VLMVFRGKDEKRSTGNSVTGARLANVTVQAHMMGNGVSIR
jgi:hypothetical protein